MARFSVELSERFRAYFDRLIECYNNKNIMGYITEQGLQTVIVASDVTGAIEELLDIGKRLSTIDLKEVDAHQIHALFRLHAYHINKLGLYPLEDITMKSTTQLSK